MLLFNMNEGLIFEGILIFGNVNRKKSFKDISLGFVVKIQITIYTSNPTNDIETQKERTSCPLFKFDMLSFLVKLLA